MGRYTVFHQNSCNEFSTINNSNKLAQFTWIGAALILDFCSSLILMRCLFKGQAFSNKCGMNKVLRQTIDEVNRFQSEPLRDSSSGTQGLYSVNRSWERGTSDPWIPEDKCDSTLPLQVYPIILYHYGYQMDRGFCAQYR